MTFRELAILMPNSKVLFSYNIESRVIFEKYGTVMLTPTHDLIIVAMESLTC